MARRGPRARRQSVRNAVAHRVVRSLLGSRAGYRRRSVGQRPMTEPTLDVTKLLAAWTAGDPVALDEANLPLASRDPDVVALDDALTALEDMDPRKSRIVELRFFAGLSVEETAAVLGVSTDTVSRDWKFAKTWLYRELRDARRL